MIDDETAYIKSLNWQTKNLTETRDYTRVVTNYKLREVQEIMPSALRRTGAGRRSTQGIFASDLVHWEPGRQRLGQMIDWAKRQRLLAAEMSYTRTL